MVIKRLKTFLTFILEFFIMLTDQTIEVINGDGTSAHSKNKKKTSKGNVREHKSIASHRGNGRFDEQQKIIT